MGKVESMRLEGFTDASEVLKSGIYALCAKGEVLYIGKSKTMLARIYTHRNNWIAKRKKGKIAEWLSEVKAIHFDEVHVFPCSVHELDHVERMMIDRYRPRINKLLKQDGKVTTPVEVNFGAFKLTLNEPPFVPEGFVRRV